MAKKKERVFPEEKDIRENIIIENGIVVSIHNYNGGPTKMQMARKWERKSGETGYRKLGRMTVDEVRWLKGQMDDILASMELRETEKTMEKTHTRTPTKERSSAQRPNLEPELIVRVCETDIAHISPTSQSDSENVEKEETKGILAWIKNIYSC